MAALSAVLLCSNLRVELLVMVALPAVLATWKTSKPALLVMVALPAVVVVLKLS